MEFVDIEPTLENYWRSIILFGRNSASYKFALAKSLIDLANYSIILPGINTYTGQIIQKLFQKEGIPLKAPMSTNYLETISTMVEVGLGWSVLPETLVRDLHVMPFEGVKIERELGYIHHTKRSLSNAAVAFLVLLRAE